MTIVHSNILIGDNRRDGWRIIYSRTFGKTFMLCDDHAAPEQKRLHVERSKAAPEWRDNVPVFSAAESKIIKGDSEEHKRGVFDAMALFPGSTIIQGGKQ